jgi:hypothetical protein
MEIKMINIKEFRKLGYLQEVNRQFFHPLGLALAINIHDTGEETLDSVWDYRDEPEGIFFADLSTVEHERKALNIRVQRQKLVGARINKVGSSVQCIGHKFEVEEKVKGR